ncbi:hypothetical protein [Sphingopyxis sp.]|uniref:hypothetical protein n=1 Tax=Sphingopyxis sp. TaxID=1908224 RepID=UPI002D7A3139|nr:hypothetical protein [Sphingopyxis sp.]HET6523570.1 hypothetical protein [Sphingopyxis sp.]
MPWTIDASDWPAFHARWPDIGAGELADVDIELQRRGEAICSDPEATAATFGMAGRSDGSSAAAAWLLERFPRADIFDPEFVEHFAHLTRLEILWAAVEHRSLIGAAVAGTRPCR